MSRVMSMRTIGVLGGMGPAATADFFRRIVTVVGAESDQAHPPCLVYSATGIPDRTAHLTNEAGADDPGPALAQAAGKLAAAGADVIAIPCNSAHAYLEVVRAAVDVEVLDMIGLAVDAVARRVADARRVGVLAASGTIQVGLYSRPLERSGIEALVPEPAIQADVMSAIRAVKGGAAGLDPRLAAAVDRLVGCGAEAIIAGCTEVPLAFDAGHCSVPFIDAAEELATAALHAVGYEA